MMMLLAERALLLLGLLLVLISPGKAASLSGEWSTLFYEVTSSEPSWTVRENLRLEFQTALARRFRFEYGGNVILEAPTPPLSDKESAYRLFAVQGSSLFHGDGYELRYDTRQLAFTLSAKRADLIVGRQVIAWGASRITNPTDLFAPAALGDFERDVRDGVDGVRIRIPTGMVSELDFGTVGEKRGESLSAAVFGRASFSLGDADGSLIYVYTGDDHFTGADLAGYLGRAGYWLEGGVCWRKARNSVNAGALSAGLEGRLTPALYSAFELLWAHASYPLRAFREAGVENTKTASLLVTLQHGLMTFSAKAMAGLEHREEILLLQGEYNIADNTYLRTGGTFVRQPSSEISSSFLALKIYF